MLQIRLPRPRRRKWGLSDRAVGIGIGIAAVLFIVVLVSSVTLLLQLILYWAESVILLGMFSRCLMNRTRSRELNSWILFVGAGISFFFILAPAHVQLLHILAIGSVIVGWVFLRIYP
ncbi:MAG TPA: hypothetical protein VJC16_06855 [Candidatus Nanoarchaeia archaeon]|nr:hypothetical protein [Candidatus Nanoarchaeia archaeon]